MSEPEDAHTAAETEALWRSIVDNYGERTALDPEPPPERPTAEPSRSASPSTGDAREDRDVLDAWDDPEDHFVQPSPAAPPLPEPPRLLAWAGVLGVPILTIALTALQVQVPSWASLLGLVWFVGGFGYLVATMRHDDDDEWDDGARL